MCGDDHQGFRRCLPFRRAMLSFGKLSDVVAGVLKRDELATAWQFDWVVECADQPFSRMALRFSCYGRPVAVASGPASFSGGRLQTPPVPARRAPGAP
jgi:hypothetical protein